MYYKEGVDQRIGFGVAGERTNAWDNDSFVWGPYLYFNRDTLDNVLIPTRGHSISSRVWWNSDEILVSHTNLTAYIPMKSDLHFVLNFGLRTGDKDHPAYRALLGSNEELFSLSRHPYAGDQAAWGHLGVGYNFYSSWWGAIRGEAFAAYGMVMDEWSRAKDAWEAGLAFSVPGQFFNGRLILVYDEDDEFIVGFTIGSPQWWSSPLP
jgi:NTE family protein